MSHRARKRFGQNFLHDPGVISRIVAAVNPQAGDTLVEIGPGLGALTQPLLAAAGRLQVVEIDRDLAAQLRETYPDTVTVHEGDALKFDFGLLSNPDSASNPDPATSQSKLRIVGNLPYNISTPLLFHLASFAPLIADLHVMLQAEVVARIVASPGTREYGRLGVMLAPVFHCERLLKVGSGAFRPAPKVDSAVIRLTPHATPPFDMPDQAAYAKLVAQAFTMRRKTLRNVFRGMLSTEQLEASGIDPGRRPDTLSPAEFAKLAKLLLCAEARPGIRD